MKRSWIALCCALLLLTAAAVLYADSSTTLSIEPSAMKEGETKSFTDDGRTITVRREGNTMHVRIDSADKTEKLTITREGNQIRMGRMDDGGRHSFVFGPERKRIVIDGLPLDELDKPRQRKLSTWFVCPKDRTMLRVPEEKTGATYKCPVDGTVMEKRKGHGFSFFFDENVVSADIL